MITAEPDVSITKLQPDDRFFILACDGVWDCLSSQQAVRDLSPLFPKSSHTLLVLGRLRERATGLWDGPHADSEGGVCTLSDLGPSPHRRHRRR
jgi:hypothetical protein